PPTTPPAPPVPPGAPPSLPPPPPPCRSSRPVVSGPDEQARIAARIHTAPPRVPTFRILLLPSTERQMDDRESTEQTAGRSALPACGAERRAEQEKDGAREGRALPPGGSSGAQVRRPR